MYKVLLRSILIVTTALTFAACSDIKEVTLHIASTADGKPFDGAQVSIDGASIGQTDAQGNFNGIIKRKYDSEIALEVTKPINGYHVEPWTQTFKFVKDGPREFKFDAPMSIKPFVTINVTDGAKPLEGAVVRVGKERVGNTDKDGTFVFEYTPEQANQPLKIGKRGFDAWGQKTALKPGDTIAAALDQQLVITVKALAKAGSDVNKLSKISVFVGEKHIGTTNNDGILRYNTKGLAGKKGFIALSAPGYLPARWEMPIDLIGDVNITRYFYPINASPTRIGFYRFVSNSGSEDIGDIPVKFHSEVEKRFADLKGFELVPYTKLEGAIKASKTTIDKLASKGWENSSLEKTIDVLAFGSVTKDVKGNYILEVKYFGRDGSLLLSEIARAKNSDSLDRGAKELSVNTRDDFPFEGTVIGKDRDQYITNLGSSMFPISRGDSFVAYNPVYNKDGLVTQYQETGGIKLTGTSSNRSDGEVEVVEKGKTIKLGARIMRRMANTDSSGEFATVATTTLLNGNIQAVPGVNIYLNQKWVASTNRDGKARVSLRVKKSYDLTLYKEGFAQVTQELEVPKNANLVEFNLESYNAMLTVESNPTGAQVFVDDQVIGSTPITEPKPVPMGFHRVRISLGGEFRDWEEIVEFANAPYDWTGGNAIALQPDYMKKGRALEAAGQIDEAINTYMQADKKHPDYADAHYRLGQLYLDNKNDVNNAVAQFEQVIEIPEIKNMIFKQYAVVYTNLGHAYHEKASMLLSTDPKDAAKYLAMSIKTLKIAKENARFFPSESYDEAIHDTYYYIALSFNKLYQLSKNASLLNQAELAWRDYFDFFPEKLAQQPTYRESREAAERYLEQLHAEG